MLLTPCEVITKWFSGGRAGSISATNSGVSVLATDNPARNPSGGLSLNSELAKMPLAYGQSLHSVLRRILSLSFLNLEGTRAGMAKCFIESQVGAQGVSQTSRF